MPVWPRLFSCLQLPLQVWDTAEALGPLFKNIDKLIFHNQRCVIVSADHVCGMLAVLPSVFASIWLGRHPMPTNLYAPALPPTCQTAGECSKRFGVHASGHTTFLAPQAMATATWGGLP
jgi:hypothetical protein